MAVEGKNRHYHWQGIVARHWLETAKRCGFGEMKAIMWDLIARTPEVNQQVRRVVPKRFPSQIADSLFEGIKGRALQLAAELSG